MNSIRITMTYKDGTPSQVIPLPFVSRESTDKIGTDAFLPTYQQDFDGARQVRKLKTDVTDEGKKLARRMKMRLGVAY